PCRTSSSCTAMKEPGAASGRPRRRSSTRTPHPLRRAWRTSSKVCVKPWAAARSPGPLEIERHGVDAVSQPGRLGAVLEDVPEVRLATCAVHLGATHEEAPILLGLDLVVGDGFEEARPAGAGVELGVRAEQVGAAGGAAVGPGLVVVPVLAGERP